MKVNEKFSEFTYGFALVNELTKVLPCKAVPLFPSLREEGKTGGGYDVRIEEDKGTILHLQFKLSKQLNRRNAREYKLPGHSLGLPYYRFEVMSNRLSRQHCSLLALEVQHPQTFYVAPSYHLTTEINTYWNSAEVAKHSVFIKPSSIGKLPDGSPHSICFDNSSIANSQAFLFSHPKEIQVHSHKDFSEGITSQVNEESELALSINHILRSYAEVVKSMEYPQIHQPSHDHFEEKVPLLSERIDDRKREKIIENLLDPPEGTDPLKLVAEVSFFVFGVQAVAVIQD